MTSHWIGMGGVLLIAALSCISVIATWLTDAQEASRDALTSESAPERSKPASEGRPEPVTSNRDGKTSASPEHHETLHFTISGAGPLTLVQLGKVAEASLTIACRRLGVDGTTFTARRLPFTLCKSTADMRAVERSYGIADAADPRRLELPGGFYRDVPMILILDDPVRRYEIAAHEVVHWVVFHITENCPRVINEGVAEFIASEAVLSLPEHDRTIETRKGRARALRAAAGDTPSLAEMLRVGYFEFYKVENYARAWCLAKVLFKLESRRPGKVRALLERFGRNAAADPWSVFCALYAEGEVERLWKRELRSVASLR